MATSVLAQTLGTQEAVEHRAREALGRDPESGRSGSRMEATNAS